MRLPVILIALSFVAGITLGLVPHLGFCDWARAEAGKVWFARGLQFTLADRPFQAIAMYTEAIELNPRHASAYVNRGNARSDLRQYDAAIQDYNHAIYLCPTLADAYNNRGTVFDNLGKNQLALGDYSQAISLSPTRSEFFQNRANLWLILGQPQKALLDCNQAIEFNSMNSIAYYLRGNAKEDLGDKQGAIAEYDQAIILSPTYDLALYNRARLKWLKDGSKTALTDINQAIRVCPSSKHYLFRGRIRWHLGDIRSALEDFDQAISLNSNDAASFSYRGCMKSRLKDFKGGTADYKTAITLAPRDAEIRTDYAIHLYRQNKVTQAINECTAATKLNSKSTNAFLFRGMFYEGQHDFALALKNYNKAIEVGPRCRAPHYRRALLKLRIGDKSGAKEDWNAVLKLDPRFKDETGSLSKL